MHTNAVFAGRHYFEGEKMGLLVLYYAIMIGFYFIASRLRGRRENLEGVAGKGLTVMMYIIVFIMGIRMGSNEEVTSNLGTIGVQAVIITVLTIGLSVLFVTIMRKIMKLDKHGDKITRLEDNTAEIFEVEEMLEAEEDAKSSNNLKTTLYIAIDVAVAMLIGYFAIRPMFADNYAQFDTVTSNAIVVGLCVMLAFVGFSLGLDGTVISKLKETGIKVILVPMMLVLGTTAGGVIFSLTSSFSIKEGLAICWGFGWYTYAPGVIAEAGYVIASAVSFLHNVIRETVGIIGIPLFAQKFGYLEATTVPGIASMDVCMPIIERSCRQDTIVYGFCNGLLTSLVCSLLVPIIISL